jgi:hypothetical protein
MNRYIVNAQDTNQLIKNTLMNPEEEYYFCSRTLEWSINNIIKDGIYDEILISYQGTMIKSFIDELAKKSQILITTTPVHSYFCRVVDCFLHGESTNDKYSVDLRRYLNDDDKIFVAHMDAFYDKSVHQDMISFNKPLVFGTNDYVVFKVNNSYYRWIADFMVLGSVEFLRKHNIRFSWDSMTQEKRKQFYKLANSNNISIGNKHLEEVENMDGLQDGSLTLGILQNTGKVLPLDLVDIGDGNIKTSKTAHLKGFFSQDPKQYRYILNNIVLHSVMFGRVQDQRDRLNKMIDEGQNQHLLTELLSYYNSYFGQQILNDQEKENFYNLLKGILT